MTEEALACKQSPGQSTRAFLEDLRAKHEAVIGAAPSDGKINVQLRTIEERCKTTVDSLNPQVRGLVLRHLMDREHYGCAPGVIGYCDPPEEAFNDWNVMVSKVCELARHFSVDKIEAPISAKAKRAEARVAAGAESCCGRRCATAAGAHVS